MKRIYQLLVLVSFLPLHLCAQLSEKVGGIAGTGNVTATGGASYSMEIEKKNIRRQ